jgi:hypothetical protein
LKGFAFFTFFDNDDDDDDFTRFDIDTDNLSMSADGSGDDAALGCTFCDRGDVISGALDLFSADKNALLNVFDDCDRLLLLLKELLLMKLLPKVASCFSNDAASLSSSSATATVLPCDDDDTDPESSWRWSTASLDDDDDFFIFAANIATADNLSGAILFSPLLF